MPDKQVVYVLSTPRSGSTLLALILGSHSRCFCLGEVAVLSRMSKDRWFRNPDKPVCGICGGDCAFWSTRLLTYLSTRAQTWGGRSRTGNPKITWGSPFYEPIFAASGADILIDSSKMVDWTRRRLKSRSEWKNKKPFFIFLHRDGRAVLNSLIRGFPDRSPRALAHEWKNSIERVESFYAPYPAHMKTRLAYRELSLNPERSARALCQSLGIAFEPAMLRYWAFDHHSIEGNKATRSSIKRQRDESLPSTRGDADRQYLSDPDQESYYRAMGPAIKLDDRWRTELSADALDIFESVAGRTNRALGTEETASKSG